MAPDQQTEDEPSIEEILDSIRQIISDEDETQSADSVEADAPEPEPVADEEEIIDLTQKVDAPADIVAEPDPTPEESAEEPAPENIEDAAMTDDPVDDIDALLSENPDDAAMQVDMEEGDGVPEPTAPALSARSKSRCRARGQRHNRRYSSRRNAPNSARVA